MSARAQRLAEMLAARARLDEQIRRLSPPPVSPPPVVHRPRPVDLDVFLTPQQIRDRAEVVRLAAINRWHDTPADIEQRRADLLAAQDEWHDPRTRKDAAA